MIGARATRLISAASFVAIACGSAAPGQSQTEQGRVVEIEMSDLAFSPPQLILAAGETVTLVFRNVGALEHEFMAGTGPSPGKGYEDDWLAKAKPDLGGHGDHAGVGVRVPPKATLKLVLEVPRPVRSSRVRLLRRGPL